ncbi:MAG: hypothetical protein AAB116_17060 [Candidatus Poribacteria bacterium]
MVLRYHAIAVTFMTVIIACLGSADERDFLLEKVPAEKLDSATSSISPNELNFYNSAHQDVSGGALISVGTFRALNNAATGDFLEIYLLDVNESVVHFNAKHLELIARSANRYAYLSNLYHDPKVGEAIKAFDEGRATGKKVGDKISRAINKLKRLKIEPFQMQDGYVYSMHRIIQDTNTYHSSFLGSDKYFGQLKKLVDSKRIFAVPGSLSGRHVMAWLGKRLQKRGVHVSVLDISNVLDYMPRDRQKRSFANNLLRLPWSKASKIHFTIDHDRIPTVKWGYSWSYYSMSLSDFMKHKLYWWPQELKHNNSSTCISKSLYKMLY